MDVQAVLDIKKPEEEETIPYAMIVSTEKVGDFVLITVVKYERELWPQKNGTDQHFTDGVNNYAPAYPS